MKGKILILSAACFLAACTKPLELISYGETEPLSDEKVFFSITEDSEFFVDTLSEGYQPTKVVTAMSLPSFKAACTKGAPGSEHTSVWNNVAFTDNGSGTFLGGQYWPHSDQGYNFYAVAATAVSDAASGPALAAQAPAMTFSPGGTTITTTGGTQDVVCAYIPYKSGTIGAPETEKAIYKTRNGLTFEHIYSRVSTVTVNTDALYRVYNVTVWLVNAKTGGTYNLRTGKNRTDGTGWSSLTPTTDADTQIYRNSGSIAVSSSHVGDNNNYYVVPGSYYLKASWTATIDDPLTTDPYIQTYSGVVSTTPVSLQGGKVNALSVTLSGNATELTFSVSVLPWTYNEVGDVGFNH